MLAGAGAARRLPSRFDLDEICLPLQHTNTMVCSWDVAPEDTYPILGGVDLRSVQAIMLHAHAADGPSIGKPMVQRVGGHATTIGLLRLPTGTNYY